MPTQQETIRELSKKKLLNCEQKKVLYKLFEAKISEKVSIVRNKYQKDEEIFEKSYLKAQKENPAVKKLLDVIASSEKAKKEAEEKLQSLGLDLSYRGLETHSYKQPIEVDKLHIRNRKKLNKIEDLKLKLLADIHGLPLTYEELTDYVEKEIAKIEVK